ncbi:hypothetical protein V8G54_028070, partial [Vigna mungo]
ALDDTNSHSLTHVSHSKTTKWRIFREGFNHHGLCGNHLHKTSISVLQEFRLLLQLFTRPPVNLGHEFGKLHGNVGGVAIKNRCIAISNLPRVIHDDNLGREICSLLRRVILGV